MEISVTVEQSLTPHLIAFRAHTFEYSCDHMVVECIHFALIVKADTVDGEPLRDWHTVSSRQLYSIAKALPALQLLRQHGPPVPVWNGKGPNTMYSTLYHFWYILKA
jgi:hypothetical protein